MQVKDTETEKGKRVRETEAEGAREDGRGLQRR